MDFINGGAKCKCGKSVSFPPKPKMEDYTSDPYKGAIVDSPAHQHALKQWEDMCHSMFAFIQNCECSDDEEYEEI